VGELGAAAYRFIDDVAAMGLTVWQFLPVGPVTFADSPYQAASIVAGNPLLIDLSALCADGLLDETELDEVRALPADHVDFGALIPLKTALLRKAAERFHVRASTDRAAARANFVAAHEEAWLYNFALFQVLRERHAQHAWIEWEPACARRDAACLSELEAEAANEIEQVKTIQFLFFEQWARLKAYAAERGVLLMGDLPIYPALDNAGVWERQDLFALESDGSPLVVGGVPPDYFSADGQRWGNPLYRWERHEAEDYAWWISRFEKLMQMIDIVRLDHFRGFEAYWAVPSTAPSAREGEWLPGPGAALFEALEAALGPLPVVAENLGVITPEVEALRRQFGFPGMAVLQFLLDQPGFDPADIPADSVCYTGTHDNDTTVGWFNGGPGDVRSPEEIERTRAAVLERTGGSAETVHEDVTRVALSSPAALAIIPMQDLLGLGSDARMNTPGTTEGNWRWRLEAGALTPALINQTRQMVVETGRCCEDGAAISASAPAPVSAAEFEG
jgi:4-alpha-glucanotransferase